MSEVRVIASEGAIETHPDYPALVDRFGPKPRRRMSQAQLAEFGRQKESLAFRAKREAEFGYRLHMHLCGLKGLREGLQHPCIYRVRGKKLTTHRSWLIAEMRCSRERWGLTKRDLAAGKEGA